MVFRQEITALTRLYQIIACSISKLRWKYIQSVWSRSDGTHLICMLLYISIILAQEDQNITGGRIISEHNFNLNINET